MILRCKGEVFTEPYLKMGKKGVDGTPVEASIESEIEALKIKLQKMEDLMQEQSKELKAEMVSSQLSMKQDIKE
jgi:hypothetical protein